MGSFYDNDEAPSIFDIAMVYENGNGGIIRPKVKKISDTYKSVSDTYKDLSDDEKKFIYKHPRYAYKFNVNAEKAKAIGRQFGGGRNGYGDAVRHCYWCALNQVSAGLNSPLAEEFGNAHENKPDNEFNEKNMDLHNNSVGYYLGNQAIKNNWSEDELLKTVIKAADDGKLKILK